MARELEFDFPLPNGLHVRPAARLCEATERFASTVTLTNRRRSAVADARSVLALVGTLTRAGDPCLLRVEGADEDEAAAALGRFLAETLPRCDEEALPAPPIAAAPRALPRVVARSGARVLAGLAVSGGVGRGPVWSVDEPPGGEDRAPSPGAPEREIARLEAALGRAAAALRERHARAVEATERAILGAHLALVEDPELTRQADGEILTRGVDAAAAVRAAAERFAALLGDSGSAYLAARVLDVRDVAARILRALRDEGATGAEAAAGSTAPVAALREAAVVVADELSPDVLLALGPAQVRGLVLERGGATSHTAILARALGIPAVAGVDGVRREVATGGELIVDGERGLVIVAPPPAVVDFYAGEARQLDERRERVARFRAAAGCTAEGRPFAVEANVASLDEVRLAFANGAEGVGVFRTEMLFMSRSEPPGEEEQARVYAEAVRLAAGQPVVVRTLDVGGDKPLPYLALPAEANPFLGYRAVRIYAEHQDLIACQVRAALRASASGPVRLLLPMACCVAEVRSFRSFVARCMTELERDGVAFDRTIEIGVMVEIPSLAFALDRLAPEVDFFSVGTNDLLQYFLAVDRDSVRVAHLYDPYHPAFLRLLRQIAREARGHGRRVGVCGELGGELAALPLLVGCGFDEVSVAPTKVAAAKAALRECREAECRALLDEATQQAGPEEVAALLRQFGDAHRDARLLGVECVRLDAGSRTKETAIRELVDLLRFAGRLDDADAVEAAVWVREENGGTGIGDGLAIPHCQSPAVRSPAIAVARFVEPVDWGAIDEAPVRLAILVVVPAGGGSEHLRTIAALARRLMDEELRARLFGARDGADVVELLGSPEVPRDGAGRPSNESNRRTAGGP